MSSWTFQPPAWWPALVVVPVVYAAGVWQRRRAQRSLRQDFGRREHELLGRPVHVAVREMLAVAALGAWCLALLRPVAPGREAQVAPDVVLCVDVSRSMAAEDVAPSRFERMRLQLRRLLERAVGSRFALVAFAGDAQVVAPLTADRAAVAWLLRELAPGAIGRSGTDLAAAIDAASTALLRVGARGEIVLLTDGEDFGEQSVRAAQAARADGHRVHCFGYGSPGGSRIVVTGRQGEQAFLLDDAGAEVVTRLDEAALAAVAAAGAGRLSCVTGEDAVADYWRDELFPYAARRRLAAGDADVVQCFWWPLLGGVLLWMLRMCLPERRR